MPDQEMPDLSFTRGGVEVRFRYSNRYSQWSANIDGAEVSFESVMEAINVIDGLARKRAVIGTTGYGLHSDNTITKHTVTKVEYRTEHRDDEPYGQLIYDQQGRLMDWNVTYATEEDLPLLDEMRGISAQIDGLYEQYNVLATQVRQRDPFAGRLWR